MSKYIVLEGIDGAGKTTQAQLLAQYLERLLRRDVELVAEPCSDWAKARLAEAQTPAERALIFSADRAALMNRIRECHDRDTWVVSDRSVLSMHAYQHQVSDEHLIALSRLAMGWLKIDLAILLHVPRWAGEYRSGEEVDSQTFKNYESMFYPHAVNMAMPVSKALGGGSPFAREFWSVYADGTAAEVHGRVCEVVKQVLFSDE